MTLLIVQLDDSEATALTQKAEAMGQKLTDYAGDILRREARRPLRKLEQIAADVEARRGGPLDMSEEEIGEMLETAKHDMRAQRNQRAGQ
jgi:hypothetical protein